MPESNHTIVPPSSKVEFGYVRFTGKYAQLKSMGFSFQKLYASNYMQWAKDGFRIWKKGSDITHDSIDLYKLIVFLKTNPETRSYNDGERIGFYKFYSDPDNNVYDYYPMTDENRQRYKEFMRAFAADDYDEENPPEYLGDTISVSMDVINQLKEWETMGWYELDYYPNE